MADLVTRLLLNSTQFDSNITKSTAEIKQFKGVAESAGKNVGTVLGSAGFGGLLKFGSIAGILTTVGGAMQESVEGAAEFEKSLSGLHALTGMTGNDLEYLKKSAIELSSTTTQSASDIVDAYTLIGSQMAELLQHKESLTAVAKAAITLAEAAGMAVPDAAKALTTSLNQMGQGAGHANEYINILAEASKEGSAEIPYLASALEKSGGAASSVGVKFNELVGSIEAIAPKISEASEAGTNLRNIFLTLESSTDQKLKPSVVGFTQALQNLSAMGLNATGMTQMFGKENVTAALALVNAKDTAIQLSKSIIGTSTAEEQAMINTDNFKGSVEKLSNSWKSFLLDINSSNGLLKTVIDNLNVFVHFMDEIYKGNWKDLNFDLNSYANSSASEYLQREEKTIINVHKQYDSLVAGFVKGGKTQRQALKAAYNEMMNVYKNPKMLVTPNAKIRKTEISKYSNEQYQKLYEDAHPKVTIQTGNNGTSSTKSNKKVAKTIEEEYDDALKKLEAKKQLKIKAGLNTDAIDAQIEKTQAKLDKFKLKMIDDSSYEGLKKKLSQLQEIQTRVKTKVDWNNLQAQIDKVQSKISEIDGTVYIKLEKGSEADLKQQLSDVESQMENTDSISVKMQLSVKKEDLKDQLKNTDQLMEPISKPVKKSVDTTFNYSNTKSANLKEEYEAEKDYLKSMSEYNKEAGSKFKYSNEAIEKQTNLVQDLDKQWKSSKLTEEVKKYQTEVDNLKYESIVSSVSTLSSVANSWKSLGETLSGDADGFDKVTAVINAMITTSDGIKGIIELFDNLTKTTQLLTTAKAAQTTVDATNTATQVADSTAATTASLAQAAIETATASELSGMYLGLAAAKTFAAHAYIPFVGTALAAGFIAQQQAGAIAAAIPKFADGGIVSGSSYFGDKLIARVNSGEMILNGTQQNNLFKILDKGTGTQDSSYNNVTFTIRGKDLMGTLENYSNKMSKIK